MKTQVSKQDILGEFETMRLLEQDAHDFYLNVSQDATVADDKIRGLFSRIADDERHHVELVDRILNIVRNCM